MYESSRKKTTELRTALEPLRAERCELVPSKQRSCRLGDNGAPFLLSAGSKRAGLLLLRGVGGQAHGPHGQRNTVIDCHATHEGDLVVVTRTVWAGDAVWPGPAAKARICPVLIAPDHSVTLTPSTETVWFASPPGAIVTAARIPPNVVPDGMVNSIQAGGNVRAVHAPEANSNVPTLGVGRGGKGGGVEGGGEGEGWWNGGRNTSAKRIAGPYGKQSLTRHSACHAARSCQNYNLASTASEGGRVGW